MQYMFHPLPSESATDSRISKMVIILPWHSIGIKRSFEGLVLCYWSNSNISMSFPTVQNSTESAGIHIFNIRLKCFLVSIMHSYAPCRLIFTHLTLGSITVLWITTLRYSYSQFCSFTCTLSCLLTVMLQRTGCSHVFVLGNITLKYCPKVSFG